MSRWRAFWRGFCGWAYWLTHHPKDCHGCEACK